MKARLQLLLISSVMISLTACTDSFTTDSDSVFRHDIAGRTVPWTHEDFDDPDDRVMIALFSDLTGGERPEIFEIAVAQLAMLRPELIMNVGDLIEGGNSPREQLVAEWESFDARADVASAPIFYVGGNHDLSNAELREIWGERYGPTYYHFRYKDMLFLVLDTEDNSPERVQEIFEIREEAVRIVDEQGIEAFATTEYSRIPEETAGNITLEQSNYFQQVIADNADVRWTFLFMHKAPWKDEAMQTFTAIEDALLDRPYTVFHGHVHAYEYEERKGRDYIQLATTGGTFFPDRGLSADHVMLLTLSGDVLNIANLRLDGILDKTGHIPLDGDDVCFDGAVCGEGN
jgi:UDP-2,3-diacylglucosamine pyrophosphatase LpxH